MASSSDIKQHAGYPVSNQNPDQKIREEQTMMKSKNFYMGHRISMDQLWKLAYKLNQITGQAYVIGKGQGQGVRLELNDGSTPLGHEFFSKNILYIQLWAYLEGLERGADKLYKEDPLIETNNLVCFYCGKVQHDWGQANEHEPNCPWEHHHDHKLSS